MKLGAVIGSAALAVTAFGCGEGSSDVFVACLANAGGSEVREGAILRDLRGDEQLVAGGLRTEDLSFSAYSMREERSGRSRLLVAVRAPGQGSTESDRQAVESIRRDPGRYRQVLLMPPGQRLELVGRCQDEAVPGLSA